MAVPGAPHFRPSCVCLQDFDAAVETIETVFYVAALEEALNRYGVPEIFHGPKLAVLELRNNADAP